MDQRLRYLLPSQGAIPAMQNLIREVDQNWVKVGELLSLFGLGFGQALDELGVKEWEKLPRVYVTIKVTERVAVIQSLQ